MAVPKHSAVMSPNLLCDGLSPRPMSVTPWPNGGRAITAALVCAAFILGGCAGKGGAAISRSANLSQAQYDHLQRWHLEPSRIMCDGLTERACEAVDPGQAVLLPDGTMLVHSQDHSVARIDAGGRVVSRFGRHGDGPGEYRSVVALGRMRSGTVWIADLARRTMLLYSPDTSTAPTATVLEAPRYMQSLRGYGDIYGYHIVPGAKHLGDSVLSTLEIHGITGKTLASVQVSAYAMQTDFSDLVPIPGWFAARPVWAIGPDSTIVYSNGKRYVVDIVGPGIRHRQLVVERPQRKVTGADIKAQAAAAQMGPHNDNILNMKSANAARMFPAITAVRVLGGQMAALRVDDEQEPDSARWDLLRTDSLQLVGFVRLGPDDDIVGGRSDSVVVMHQTVNGVSQLLIERLGSGPF